MKGGAALLLAASVAASALVGCAAEGDAATGEADASSASGEGGDGGGTSTAASGSGTGGSTSSAPAGTGGAGGGLDCASAPLVTWASFGDAFATRHCTGCHASTTVDRHGAPDGVDFDDKDTFLAYAYRILDLVDPDPAAAPTDDAVTMPPGGGVDEDERALLRIWLTCNLEADRAGE